jgi:hypothetical protein
MKYSTENYANSADITVIGVVGTPATPVSTMVDKRTTRAYFAEQDGGGGVTITVDLSVERDVSLVALVGITAIESATITLRYLSSDVDSQVVSLSQPVQQTYMVATFDFVGADEVTIAFNVGDGVQWSVGYLYIGDLSEAVKIADGALNYSVVSTDPRNITRAGTPLRSTGYLFAQVDFTIVEETFSDLRTRVVQFASDGFATPRLWYFDEDCIFSGEAIYGILDSDSLQLDPRFFRRGSEAKAVTTLGLVEVF